jgi:WhiB family redox-sensing transcriptional regulator
VNLSDLIPAPRAEAQLPESAFALALPEQTRRALEEFDELEWQVGAVCAQTDPEAFFPERGGSTRGAKRICSGCGVRAECLDYALAHDERFGVWGGLSERERRRLRAGEQLPVAVRDDVESMGAPGPTATSEPSTARRFVDPDKLICSGCGAPVRPAPPAYWRVADGLPVPQMSHEDRTALCGDPIEVDR